MESLRAAYSVQAKMVESQADAEMVDLDTLFVGDPASIEMRLKGILPTAASLSDKSYFVQILSRLATAQAVQKNFEGAFTSLDEAEKACIASDFAGWARLVLEKGRVFQQSENLKEAKRLFEEVFQFSREHQLDDYACDAAHMVAIVTKEVREKIRWNEIAIGLATSSNVKKANAWLGSLYNDLGSNYFEAKEYEKALQPFQRALELREAEGVAENIRVAKWQIARVMRCLDWLDEALIVLTALKGEQDSLVGQDEMTILLRGYIYMELAEVYAAKGDAKAKEHAQIAFKDLSSIPWVFQVEPERNTRLKELLE